MPRSRSRSRSPAPRRNEAASRRSRSRTRSPQRRNHNEDSERREGPRRERRGGGGGGGGGFKWKEKRKDNTNESREEPRRLERGYRKRTPSPRRDRASTGAVDVEDKFGVADKFGKGSLKSRMEDVPDGPPKRAPAVAAAAAPAAISSEPMIIVHVNDRLGTKAAIPCLASDPIRLFKAQVAARIGREPHEILLKRQGERPFKDQLTLADYEISNGVQLDLEVDTGD
ncbi:MAG: hypothetical protein M1818_000712 [Claussenomyces sp. TS43310]|nr:MAG: hypothetical protein M1818_000712 [Claussenomyces sp. TS43310]